MLHSQWHIKCNAVPRMQSHLVRKPLHKETFVQGHAKFTSSSTVEVNGQTLSFATAVIATGANARIPNTLGINSVPYLTNVSFWNQTKLPERLLVMGSGPIGVIHQYSACVSLSFCNYIMQYLQLQNYAWPYRTIKILNARQLSEHA